MEKKRVIIDVETWGKNALLNDDGTKCCLGFISEQALGAKPTDILGKSYYPKDMTDTVPDWYEDRHAQAAGINDSSELSQDVKMRRLRDLFAESPIELVFTENGVELP